MTNFAFPDMPQGQLSAASEVAKSRTCVSCGAFIRKGHICNCQAEDAINCPKCKKHIRNPRASAVLTDGTPGPANFELQIRCKQPGCDGYVYTYIYAADLVNPPYDKQGQA